MFFRRFAFSTALLAVSTTLHAYTPPYSNPPPYPSYPDPGPTPVVHAWPSAGVPFCTAAGNQNGLVGTDDHAHGAYFAWNDFRDGNSDVYTIRLGPDGHPSAGWSVNGTRIVGGPATERVLKCFSDSAGAVFVVWTEDP